MRQFSSTLKFINGFMLEPIDPYHLCGERYPEELLFMYVVDKIAHIQSRNIRWVSIKCYCEWSKYFRKIYLCVLVIEMALVLLPINVVYRPIVVECFQSKR